MTIPLDNLYDYIFSLTGHTNKNLIMYRFDPHGSKNLKNLVIHNDVDIINVKTPNMKSKKPSLHYKILFCYDQEPLNFDFYAGDYFCNERKELFNEWEGEMSHFNDPIGKRLTKKQNIAGHPIVIPTIYDEKLLLHSEKNSRDLEKYEKNGFTGVYYWSHAFIALDWYRFAEHDRNLSHFKNFLFRKDFNIYCRAWTGTREYRLKFLSILKRLDIDKKSNIFFNSRGNEYHFSDYEIKNRKWEIDREDIKNLDYNTRQNHTSVLSASYSHTDYCCSAIDVVLETVFDCDKIQLTEKILRPIACGKPFILVSEKGSLEYLRSYGFKTFNNLIDESYDSIACPMDRLLSITNTMKSISTLPNTQKTELFFEMHEIAKQNKKWFFSDEFFKIINDELKENLQVGLKKLDNPKYQTGKNPRLYYRAYRRYRKYFTESTKRLADDFINEYPKRIELSKKNIGIS